MKTLQLLGLALLFMACRTPLNQHKMTQDIQTIQDRVIALFVNSDKRNWEGVEAQMADSVLLDYSSMTGNPAATLNPKDITSAWATVLPGFTHTHHQIGNILVHIEGNEAKLSCYGTATHYLDNDEGSIWTVVGTYDFNLSKEGDTWKVTSMTFNYKYQSGNANLVALAIENVKSKG